ncbi:hypothetical protein ILYODFUR_037328 [Ilyodon furcidens]|uniref:Uncharacterized protein n=1 Tax=Ilyodon furcidens TaxID=33524 RepID=A0ABV0T731_9TELE
MLARRTASLSCVVFRLLKNPEHLRHFAAADLPDSCLTPLLLDLSTLHRSQASQPQHCSTKHSCPLCVLGALVLTTTVLLVVVSPESLSSWRSSHPACCCCVPVPPCIPVHNKTHYKLSCFS